MIRRGLTAVLVLALPSLGGSQTNDHFFRSWRWTEEATSPRPASLAGAMTAVGDDSAAAVHNPAGLASLTKAEIAGGLSSRRDERAPQGDSLEARTGLGLAVGAARLGSRWVAAAYVAESHVTRIKLDPTPLPDGFADVGSLEATVTDFGLAAGWRVTSRLHLGARLAASRLSIDGEYGREPAAGPTNLRVGTGGRATQATSALGAVFLPTSRLRVAVVASGGARWRVQRTATSPVLGVVLDPGSDYEVRAPRVVSAGLALQASLKLMLAAQVDRVRYHDVASSLVIAQGAHARDDYALADAWEPRVGVELSLPRRAATFQLRAGVHWQAAGALRYTGSEAAEAAAFVGSSGRTLYAVGGSLVTARWLRVDLTGRFGRRRSDLLVGTAFRF